MERRRLVSLLVLGLVSRAGADPAGAEEGVMREAERRILMLEMHKLIEAAAADAAARLAGRAGGSLTYPPGTRGLAPEHAEALRALAAPAAVEAAARRLVADAAASAVYDLLCLIDGAREPEGQDVVWRPFHLQAAPGGTPGRLHLEFKETYGDWKRLRPDPGWTLE